MILSSQGLQRVPRPRCPVAVEVKSQDQDETQSRVSQHNLKLSGWSASDWSGSAVLNQSPIRKNLHRCSACLVLQNSILQTGATLYVAPTVFAERPNDRNKRTDSLPRKPVPKTSVSPLDAPQKAPEYTMHQLPCKEILFQGFKCWTRVARCRPLRLSHTFPRSIFPPNSELLCHQHPGDDPCACPDRQPRGEQCGLLVFALL